MSQPLEGTNDNAYDHDPGARPIWFGKHEGMRFDELELSYRLVLLRYCEERPAPNVRSSVSLYRQFVLMQLSWFASETIIRNTRTGYSSVPILAKNQTGLKELRPTTRPAFSRSSNAMMNPGLQSCGLGHIKAPG